MDFLDDYWLRPDPADPRLSVAVSGRNEVGETIDTRVTVERALTLFLNAREIVTMMTIGDHPEYLALGYLLNQNMLTPETPVTGIDYDDDLGVVVVRTEIETDFEDKLKNSRSKSPEYPRSQNSPSMMRHVRSIRVDKQENVPTLVSS